MSQKCSLWLAQSRPACGRALVLHAAPQSTADYVQSFNPNPCGVQSGRARCSRTRSRSIRIGTGFGTSTGTGTCAAGLSLRCCYSIQSRAADSTDKDSPNTTNEARELGAFRVAAVW